jgi:hypothetical protein
VTSEQRIEYARTAWEEFQKRSGQLRDMSSAEFDLLHKWAEKGLPLPVVLRGIAETGGKPRTLHACVPAVTRALEYRAQALPEPFRLGTPEQEQAWDAERVKRERERIFAKYGRTA